MESPKLESSDEDLERECPDLADLFWTWGDEDLRGVGVRGLGEGVRLATGGLASGDGLRFIRGDVGLGTILKTDAQRTVYFDNQSETEFL